MSAKKVGELFGELAESLENAASTLRKIQNEFDGDATKSGGDAADGASGGAGGSGGKKGAAGKAVAAKSAKGGRSKAPSIDFDAVKEKLSELMTANGKQAVKEILSEFGAAKLADLEESDYAEVHAKAVEALNADEGSDDDDDMFGDD